jgi:hypothetical protein
MQAFEGHIHWIENFCGDYDFLAPCTREHLGQALSSYLLAFTTRIGVSGIEKINALLYCATKKWARCGLI